MYRSICSFVMFSCYFTFRKSFRIAQITVFCSLYMKEKEKIERTKAQTRRPF